MKTQHRIIIRSFSLLLALLFLVVGTALASEGKTSFSILSPDDFTFDASLSIKNAQLELTEDINEQINMIASNAQGCIQLLQITDDPENFKLLLDAFKKQQYKLWDLWDNLGDTDAESVAELVLKTANTWTQEFRTIFETRNLHRRTFNGLEDYLNSLNQSFNKRNDALYSAKQARELALKRQQEVRIQTAEPDQQDHFEVKLPDQPSEQGTGGTHWSDFGGVPTSTLRGMVPEQAFSLPGLDRKPSEPKPEPEPKPDPKPETCYHCGSVEAACICPDIGFQMIGNDGYTYEFVGRDGDGTYWQSGNSNVFNPEGASEQGTTRSLWIQIDDNNNTDNIPENHDNGSPDNETSGAVRCADCNELLKPVNHCTCENNTSPAETQP